MRWVWPAALLCASGCSSILGIDDFALTDAGPGGDATGDAPPSIDAPAGCLGSGRYTVCLPTAPSEAIELGSPATGFFDTGAASSRCAPSSQIPPDWRNMQGQPDACFVIATTITLSHPIHPIGPRPLVLVATESIEVNAGLDVAAHAGDNGPPPGSPAQACQSHAPLQGNTQGSPGGAGGSFMTRGGDGGSVQGIDLFGGVAFSPVTPPPTLRAGCPGGSGGGIVGGSPGGPAGVGGGAIYLVAGQRIAVNAFINASGSGGQPGGSQSGGGGGGAGGMIVLHAPMILGNGGVVMANGGGGAGGSANNLGTSGQDPQPSSPTQPAFGGGGAGSPGGNGFAGMTAAQRAPDSSLGRGAGGGGGGGGYIQMNVPPQGLVVSPAPRIVP